MAVNLPSLPQWLPPAWTFQWIFLAYRWLLCSYFGGWLLYYAIDTANQGVGGRFFIYLSNWGYLLWVAYLLSAAVAVTVHFVRTYTCNHIIYFPRAHAAETLLDSDSDRGCCKRNSDKTNCCDKLTWLLFVVGAEGAVIICILFWATEYNESHATGKISLHLHLVNAVMALVDLWLSGVPVFFLHVIYVQLFGSVYVGFTGVYYGVNGTNSEGERWIYPVLDYGSHPGIAAGLAVGMVVVGAVVIHLAFLVQYLCRWWITSRLLGKYKHRYQLTFSTSAAPDPSSQSSSPSSLSSDTTPILASTKQRSTHSSQESFL